MKAKEEPTGNRANTGIAEKKKRTVQRGRFGGEKANPAGCAGVAKGKRGGHILPKTILARKSCVASDPALVADGRVGRGTFYSRFKGPLAIFFLRTASHRRESLNVGERGR